MAGASALLKCRVPNYVSSPPMNAPRKILVTNAPPYANGDIHLGHLVGYIQADIWVRYQRMRGNQVHYVCADDTHGTPVMLRAEKEGLTPEQPSTARAWRTPRDFRDFGVEFDNYHSTHGTRTAGTPKTSTPACATAPASSTPAPSNSSTIR